MFDHSVVSRQVSFYRKPVPFLEEVHMAYDKALNGDISGAIELLNWRRHCFHVKNEYEAEIMKTVFELYKRVSQ